MRRLQTQGFILKLKLLLMKHGTCSACGGTLTVKYCGHCFNTRLEPKVLEAMAAIDLAGFERSNDALFETLSSDNVDPSSGLNRFVGKRVICNQRPCQRKRWSSGWSERC